MQSEEELEEIPSSDSGLDVDEAEEVEARAVPEGMNLVGEGVNEVDSVPMKNVCRCPLCGEVVGFSPTGIPTFHVINRHPDVGVQAFTKEWLGKIETWKVPCTEEDIRKREAKNKNRMSEKRRYEAKRKKDGPRNFNRSLGLIHNLDRKMVAPTEGRRDEWVADAREQMRQQLEVMPEWQKLGLPEDAMCFVTLYVTNGFDARSAFKATFPDARPRGTHGARYTAETYLQRKDVQQLITAYMTQWLKVKGQELNHILFDTLYTMAFYDPADIINVDGSPAYDSWDQIPANVRRCIDHVETKYYGKDADRYSICVTMTDRKKAIEAISKFMAVMKGSFTEPEQNVGVVTTETELLLQSVLGGSRKVEQKVNSEQIRYEDIEPKPSTDEGIVEEAKAVRL